MDCPVFVLWQFHGNSNTKSNNKKTQSSHQPLCHKLMPYAISFFSHLFINCNTGSPSSPAASLFPAALSRRRAFAGQQQWFFGCMISRRIIFFLLFRFGCRDIVASQHTECASAVDWFASARTRAIFFCVRARVCVCVSIVLRSRG